MRFFHEADFGLLTLLRRPLLSYNRIRTGGIAVTIFRAAGASCLTFLSLMLSPAVAQRSDILDLIERDLREQYEDRARARARARSEEITSQKREELPDLSQYGRLLEGQAPRRQRARSSGNDCITVDLTDDMRATHCF